MHHFTPILASLLAALLLATACGDDSGQGSPDGAAPADAQVPLPDGAPGPDSGPGRDAASSPDGGPGPTCDDTPHAGEATFYAADGSGACSFAPSPGDLRVAALNLPDWAGSAHCGACARVVGPLGELTVRIVDQCPGCASGDLDLSQSAFAAVADPLDGRVEMTWTFVPCEVTGPIVYHFKEGSNQWWSAVQIRNHRHAVTTLEWLDGADWVDVPRVDYNFFVRDSGMGPGPYTFRVTDVYGQTLEDDGIPFIEAGDAPGAGQFPPCQ